MLTATNLLGAIPPASREKLLEHAHEVAFPTGTRIFEEGHRADRFWVIRSGTVRLNLRVPTLPSASVEELHAGDLLGWSWLVPPHEYHLGARAAGPVHALEFDAPAVRGLCEEDAELGRAVWAFVARTIADRLLRSRARLLDLYGPRRLAAEIEEESS